MATFNIRFDADWTLDIDEIWPDGDAPENPTADDVRRVIMECGGIVSVMHEWELVDLFGDAGKFTVTKMEAKR